MDQGDTGRETAVSIGDENQAREADMADKQREEDDGIGVPPEANPHVPSPDSRSKSSKIDKLDGESRSPGLSGGNDNDVELQSGQTPDEGLGGGGPVQT